MKIYKDVNLKLQIYILKKILPQYKQLDAAHNKKHIKYVISRSVKIAKFYGQDVNMAYCIAAFHDIGMLYGRKQHELRGADIIANDNEIKKLFNLDQMKKMMAAIKEHRASYKGSYTSIYSQIISQADRSFDINLMVERSLKFGIAYFPDYSYEQHYQRTYKYLKQKYGREGYVHMVLDYMPDLQRIEKIQKIIEDRKAFRLIFDSCYYSIISSTTALHSSNWKKYKCFK